MAIIVRMGEKRILQSALRVLSTKGITQTDTRQTRKRSFSRSSEGRASKVSKVQ